MPSPTGGPHPTNETQLYCLSFRVLDFEGDISDLSHKQQGNVNIQNKGGWVGGGGSWAPHPQFLSLQAVFERASENTPSAPESNLNPQA